MIPARAEALLKDKPERTRPSYLEMAARQSGLDEMADAIAAWAPHRGWSVPWAHWIDEDPCYLLGRHCTETGTSKEVLAVTVGRYDVA